MTIARTKPDAAALDGRPLKTTHPLYDKALSQELARRKARLAKRRLVDDVGYWQQGNDYLVIRDRKLYRQDGHASMSPWIALHHKRSRTMVAERMRFAQNFSLEEVREHGGDKLKLALRYMALTAREDETKSLASLVVQVPLESGRIEGRSFADVLPAELEVAIGHQQMLARLRLTNAVPRPEREALAQFEEALLLPGGERSLAEIVARPAPSGLAEDTTVTIRLRYGDLPSVIERLASAMPRPDGRRRPRNH